MNSFSEDPNKIDSKKAHAELDDALNGKKLEKKSEPEITVGEEDFQKIYDEALSRFPTEPFSIQDLIDSMSGGHYEMEESEERNITKIFDTLVERKKFKKEGDKYSVVSEIQQPEVKYENTEAKEEFHVPQEVFDEIYLIKKKPGRMVIFLNHFIYDIDRNDLDKATHCVYLYRDNNVITPDEADKILGMLGAKKVEEKIETQENVEQKNNNLEFSVPQEILDDPAFEKLPALRRMLKLGDFTKKYSISYFDVNLHGDEILDDKEKERLVGLLENIEEKYIFIVPNDVLENETVIDLGLDHGYRNGDFTKSGVKSQLDFYIKDEETKKRLFDIIDKTELTKVSDQKEEIKEKTKEAKNYLEGLNKSDKLVALTLFLKLYLTDNDMGQDRLIEEIEFDFKDGNLNEEEKLRLFEIFGITTNAKPEDKIKPESEPEKEKSAFGFNKIKEIVNSLLGGKAKINRFDFEQVPEGLKLIGELDAGMMGGKIKIEATIINDGNGISISNLKIEARGYVKSMIEENLSRFAPEIKAYFENQKGKRVSSVKIIGSELVVEYELDIKKPKKTEPEPQKENPPVPPKPSEADPNTQPAPTIIFPTPHFEKTPPVSSEPPKSPEAGPGIPHVETEAERVARIETELNNAQEAYAKLLVDHKAKNREKKRWYGKIISDLGFERQMPEAQKPPEVKEAERLYIEAKKKKMQEIFARPITAEELAKLGLGLEVSAEEKVDIICKVRALEQAETEFEKLQNRIIALTPKEEKGRVRKTLERGFSLWRKVPLAARIGTIPILMGIAMAVLPTGGLIAGATVAGVRLGRSIGGIVGAKYTGKAADSGFKYHNETNRMLAQAEYGNDISEANFEQKEKEFTDYLNREKNAKKRQIAYKTALMIAGGVGAGLGVGHAEASLQNSIHDYLGPTGGYKPRIGDEVVPAKKPIVPDATKPSPTAPTEAPVVKPVVPPQPDAPKIELRPDAAIEASKHANTNDLSEMRNSLQEMMDNRPNGQPYEIPHGQFGRVVDSGVLQKPSTESIGAQIDSEIKSSSLNSSHDFSKMDMNVHKPSVGYILPTPKISIHDVETPEQDVLIPDERFITPEHFRNPNIINIPKTVVFDNVETQPESHLDFSATEIHKPSIGHIEPDNISMHDTESINRVVPLGGDFVNQNINIPKVDLENLKTSHLPSYLQPFESSANSVVFKGAGDIKDMVFITNHGETEVVMAHFIPTTSGNGGALQLLDEYQDGKDYTAIREAFVKSQDLVLKNSTPIGKTVFPPVPFEGGRVTVVQGVVEKGVENPNTVKVLLNGKEIAKGLVTDKGPHIEMLKGLKKPWYLSEHTVYERAFEKVSPFIKTLKNLKG